MHNIFQEELEKGTGIPYILIKNETIKSSKYLDYILLENIKRNTAYDPQCEGSRAEYLYKIVSVYQNNQEIYEKVLLEFNKMSGIDFDEFQIFDFVVQMSLDKKIDKQILFDKIKFYIKEYKNDDFAGISLLVENYGIEGALFVAEELGKLISQKDDAHFNYFSFYHDCKNKDEIDLKLNESSNEYIQLYLNKYKDVKDKKVPEKNRMTTEQIIQKIENNKIPGIRYWLRNSTDNEKNDIGSYFLSCKDEQIRKNIICCKIKKII